MNVPVFHGFSVYIFKLKKRGCLESIVHGMRAKVHPEKKPLSTVFKFFLIAFFLGGELFQENSCYRILSRPQ
jgi:hypothetical protein